MDQRVIRSMKAHYRRRIVRLCIKSLNEDKPLPKITILQAMKNLVSSWNAVSEETIVSCFKEPNISYPSSASCMNHADILAEVTRPDSTEGEDDGDNNVDDLNDNIDVLDCPPPLKQPSKEEIVEAWDKLGQDLSLFSSYGDEIRSLTLKIETFCIRNEQRA